MSRAVERGVDSTPCGAGVLAGCADLRVGVRSLLGALKKVGPETDPAHRGARATKISASYRVLAVLMAFALPLLAAIEGVVINRTTGKPEARVPVTLISFAQGMDPIEEVYTDDNGRFAFEKDPAGMRMLRTEHRAISYTHPMPPGEQSPVEFEIFDSAARPAVEPTGRVLVIEPGAAEMIVNESYLFENKTDPPVTYRDADNGSLRFFLPPEAKGIVQVEASGPARMPLPSSADKTAEEGIYKVDFPIKPGENRISLTYLVPHADGESVFAGRSVYRNLQTRIAVPAGVELVGEGLQDFGTEPSTQATIYETPAGGSFSVTVRGQGRLQRSDSGPGPSDAPTSGPAEISVEPAPISKEVPWLLGLALAILAIGFCNLYTSRESADPAVPEGDEGKQATRRKT